LVWIDVRPKEMYEEKSIPGSISMPFDTIKDNIQDVVKDKDTKIITQCKLGMTSAKAAQILVDLGYTDVSSMDGGIEAWPYETQ